METSDSEAHGLAAVAGSRASSATVLRAQEAGERQVLGQAQLWHRQEEKRRNSEALRTLGGLKSTRHDPPEGDLGLSSVENLWQTSPMPRKVEREERRQQQEEEEAVRRHSAASRAASRVRREREESERQKRELEELRSVRHHLV